MAISPETIGQAQTIFTAVIGAGYVAYNEFISKKKEKTRRKESTSSLGSQVETLRNALTESKKRHSEEIGSVASAMKSKNDLVLVQSAIFEEERRSAWEESANEQRAAVRGAFLVLRSDLIGRFRKDLETAAAVWECPICDKINNNLQINEDLIPDDLKRSPAYCPNIDKITAASIKGYEGVIDRALLKGEELARGFVLWNGFFGLPVNDLEKYLIDKNREIHRLVWDAIRDSATPDLIEGIRSSRATEEFTLTYWRGLIATICRIRSQEKERISAAKQRYDIAVGKIYGDKQEGGVNGSV